MENFDDVIPKLKALQDNGPPAWLLMILALIFLHLLICSNLPSNYLKIDKSFIDKIVMDTIHPE